MSYYLLSHLKGVTYTVFDKSTYYMFRTCRLCYFTSLSTNRKQDFMRELAMSYRCLHCSFLDKDLSEYIQWKKRNSGHLPLKYAVAHVGVQEDGTWVVGESGYLSPKGEVIPIEESRFIWISNVFNGVGVADAAQQCKIELPLTSDPLRSLLAVLREASQHNFIPSLLLIAGI